MHRAIVGRPDKQVIVLQSHGWQSRVPAMLFFGHVGTSVFVSEKLQGDRSFGARALVVTALCAILPDLVDKPIQLFGFAPVPTGRLWGHTVLFSLLWCVVCRVWLKSLWPWALATPGHLLLDSMWFRPHTLAWPLFGARFDVPALAFAKPLENLIWQFHHEPLELIAYVVLPDIAGLALAILVWKRVSLGACA